MSSLDHGHPSVSVPESPLTQTLQDTGRALRFVENALRHGDLLLTETGMTGELTVSGAQVVEGVHRILVDHLERLELLLPAMDDEERPRVAHVRRQLRLAVLALFATLQDQDAGVDVPEVLTLATDCLRAAQADPPEGGPEAEARRGAAA